MRFIKSFLVVIIGLFTIVTLMSLLIPSTVKISRSVTISADRGKVYEQVVRLQNWKNWHPIFKSDSTVITFTNDGCNINYNNKLTRLQTKSVDSTGIQFLLAAKGENDILNQINILPVTQPNTVYVEWTAFVKLKWYPWEKLYGMVVDKIAGPGYEAALNDLKSFVEQTH